MATINTVEDLIRILEENPVWLDRIRSLILTDELMRLPARFDQHVENFDRHVENFNRFAAQTNSRLNTLEDGQRRLEERQGGLEEKQGGLEERQGRLEERFDRLLDDVGVLKGAHVSTVSERHYEVIALEMGFVSAKVMSLGEIYRIGTSSTVQDLGRDALRSFRDADMIIEVSDDEGRDSCIAVEASYVINGRDTRRAIRNAEILTRVTGRDALPAVCGYDVDDTVKETIDSGAVHWHRLTRKDLAPR